MSNIDKNVLHTQQLKSFITGFLSDPAHDNQSSRSMTAEVFRIALASLEADAVYFVEIEDGQDINAGRIEGKNRPDLSLLPDGINHLYTATPAPANVEPVAWLWSNRKHPSEVTLVRPEDDEKAEGAHWSGWSCQALYAEPPAPVSVPESAPVAYIFKHPAGRLFWSLTDESNKGQSDVIPVYSTPVPAFVPPAIEPDYEVIKGILPTANPDEYACCIAADMWNACRAAMLQGAEPVSKRDELPDGWVACSERMPEQFVEVLACTEDGGRYVAALNQRMTWDDGDFFDDIQDVTHWQPLPFPPLK